MDPTKPLSPALIGAISFFTTVAIVGALFALEVIPLWLAVVILAADAAFTYLLVGRLSRTT